MAKMKNQENGRNHSNFHDFLTHEMEQKVRDSRTFLKLKDEAYGSMYQVDRR